MKKIDAGDFPEIADPICDVEHKCAVCGGPALEPGHAKRASCPEFLVRCAVCWQYKRGRVGQVFAGDLEPKDWPYPSGTIFEIV